MQNNVGYEVNVGKSLHKYIVNQTATLVHAEVQPESLKSYMYIGI